MSCTCLQASQQQPSKPEAAQKAAPEQPFGSTIAAAPALSGAPQQPAQAAGAQQAGSGHVASAGTSAGVGPAPEEGLWHSSSNGAGNSQPKQGPFGSSAGMS